MAFTVVALYKFIPINDLIKTRGAVNKLCDSWSIYGGLIFASEGINGTIAGSTENIPEFIKNLIQVIPLDDHEMKFSKCDKNPFYRMVITIIVFIEYT